MRTFTIAGFTFREAARKKVLFGAIALTLAFVALYALGSYFAFRDLQRTGVPNNVRVLATSQLLMAGLYVVNFLGGLLAVFISVGTISTEVDQGTLHVVVPKPLGRWEIVMGKWLGYALMLLVYVTLTSWLILSIVFLLGDYLPPRPVSAVALMALEAILLLSLSILGSTFLPTVTNGILLLILYAIATVAGMVEQIGSLLQNNTMVNIGIITSFIIPSDSLWKLTAHWLQETSSALAVLNAGPFTVISPPSPWMLVYALLYTTVVLGAAVLIFRRRDL